MRLLIGTVLLSMALAAAPAGISVNGSANGTRVERGLPVILSVTLTGASAESMAETLEAAGPENAKAVLIRRTAAPEEMVLGEKVVTRTWVWTLGPDGTAALAGGTYRVSLSGGDTVSFVIAESEGSSDSAQSRTTRLLLLSEYAELAGETGKARELTEQLVRDQPESVAGKLRLSDLLAGEGRLAEALRLLDEAEMQLRREQRLKLPPLMIRVRQAEILERMTSAEQ